jgi:photosystem II stability/assembly factor-like uncharacterized protein
VKKIFYILLITQLTINLSFSQSGWFWQNPLPQGNDLHGLKMFDANTGFCYNYDNILKTTNGGENWQILYTGYATNLSGLSMVDVNLGYVLLDSTKLLKTVNGGINWSFVANLTGVKLLASISQSLYFLNQNTGYILSRCTGYNSWKGTKLFRTTNAGQNWNAVISDTGFVLFRIFFPSSSTGYLVGWQYLYGSGQYHFKIFKTTNAGNTWDSIANNMSFSAQSLFFTDENTGYVGGQLTQASRIFKTTNGGINWILLNTSFGQGVWDIKFFNESTGYAVDGNGYFCKTTNGGVNWAITSMFSVSGQNYLRELYFTDLNTACGIGSGGLLLKTTNGGSNWIKKSYGTYYWLNDVKFSDINTGFIAGDCGTLLKTTNGGINWELTQFYIGDHLSPIAKVNPDIWYLGSYPDGKIFKTTNTGLTWDTLYLNEYAITRLEFLNANTGFGVCKYSTFFKTTNAGLNWIIYNNLNYEESWALDFINENVGYVGGSHVHKTTNGGISWDTLTFGLEFGTSDIQFVNLNTGFICATTIDAYIGYTGYVMKTTNGGSNWTANYVINNPLTDMYFLNERIGFVLSWSGIFKTINGGENWFQIRSCSNNSLNVVYFLDSSTGYIVGSAGTIIKTTNGGGEPIGIHPISNEIPKQFILHQNYPNPFNPTTKINYELPITNYVKLTVYDILGREIEILVNEKQSAGIYEVEWNGTNYSSGVYFYKLNAGDFAETKKMVLIK